MDGDAEIGPRPGFFEPLHDLGAGHAQALGRHHFEVAGEDGLAAAEIARSSGEKVDDESMEIDDLSGGRGGEGCHETSLFRLYFMIEPCGPFRSRSSVNVSPRGPCRC